MKGELRIMGTSGDEMVQWDTEVQETVDTASQRFAELLLGGHLGFVTIGETRQIKEFDPTAERIVVTIPLAGGYEEEIMTTSGLMAGFANSIVPCQLMNMNPYGVNTWGRTHHKNIPGNIEAEAGATPLGPLVLFLQRQKNALRPCCWNT